MKTSTAILTSLLALTLNTGFTQSCSPQGDQVSYGTGNIWIGYVYQGMNFNTYKGYVTEGSSSNPNFYEAFGGNEVTYNTNGCSIFTDTFSVRYKLLLNYSGTFDITVGGDDGIRLSIDGGKTWLIDHWNDQDYTTFTAYNVSLSGSSNVILEYYEHFLGNQVSFNITPSCVGNGNPALYGTNDVWNGYVYQGMNFDTYKGYVSEGANSSLNFDENFGASGSVTTYSTSNCSIQTQQFSVRYRLQQTINSGHYTFTVGGAGGYRFSLDGGNTWVINSWNDQPYGTTSYSANLSGNYDMVFEYFHNQGAPRATISLSGGTSQPPTIAGFSGQILSNGTVMLDWETMMEANNQYFLVERSGDGVSFQTQAKVATQQTDSTHAYELIYSYNDLSPIPGISYYRLEMVDKYGFSSFTKIVRVQNEDIQGIKIFPTVVENNNIFVQTDKSIRNAKMEVYDLSGKKISETVWQELSGRQNFALVNNPGRMATGAYVVRLTANGDNLLHQLIILQSK